MLNKDELEAAITHIKPVQTNQPQLRTITRYDAQGKINNQLTDEQAIAIEMPLGRGYSYKIKIQRGGRIFNPLDGNKTNSRRKLTKDLDFKFREVSEKAFKTYLKFLQTGYDSYLVAVQREIL
jgi:hypothetical protein